MKRIFTLCMALCTTLGSFAQADTTIAPKPAPQNDTIRIGGLVIIRKAGSKDKEILHDKEYRMRNRHAEKPGNLSTNWWIMDLGFSNYTDNSSYPNVLTAGVSKDDLQARAGRSRNVNLWFFMQKLNITKHVLNLKYGLGLELNNYHFENDKIIFTKNPTLITQGIDSRKKVKLAADYLTVPMMLNINFTPNRKRGFGISGGVSAGYLYSARFKTKNDGDVKKVKSDFDLERFKLSYIGELSLGPVKLYGSYATKNMWQKGLDMTPYTLGFRFSNW
ncbi:MAG: outer membrane beta-barrel protein [Sphingobacteriales bacterium]|nr:outer membrane beta-barrel protein [Sphingobacteriales bacterium]